MASEEQEDFSKLTTEELILHKSWKARVKGYEDAMKTFGKASEKDPVFNKFLGLMKQFVSDSNQVALEKGLDAAYVFIENAAVSPKTAGETCPLLVQKCLGLPKQKLRDKAQEILLMYIEVEKPDVVVEALLEGLKNKNPKLVSAALVTFTTAVNQFGPKAFSIKQLLKEIGPLMEHRDADVRGKTKALAIEIYKWIGSALKPQLQTLTPLQLNELEAEFANVGGDKPVPSRYLRSQKPKEDVQIGEDAQAGGDTADGAPAAGAPIEAQDADPWEFLAPFDLVSKLPANFYEQLESKKWSERKEKLDELEKLLKDNPRLDEKGTYGELVSVLKKVIGKDSNINVVAIAGKCMACLASGLRKKYGTFAPMVAPVILEKFKEKKPVVATAMVECIDAIAKTTTLDALTEDLIAALDSKTPSVKVQTTLFLSRYFSCCSPAILNKKVLKTFCPAFLKLLADSDVEVREAVSVVLGTAMKVVGEKTILQFLEDVVNDHLKMDKIKACCEKAEVKITIVSGGGDAAPAAKAAGAASKKEDAVKKPKSAPAKAGVRPKPEPAVENEDQQCAGDAPKKTVASASAKPRTSTAKGPRSASNARKPTETTKAKREDDSADGGALIETNQKAQRFHEEKSLKVLKWQFTTPAEEHVVQLKTQLAVVCKPFLHAQMFHPDFKQHLKALEALTASVEQCPDAVIGSLDLLLKWCTLRFFDTNPSVLSRCLTFIKTALALCQDRGLELHDIEVNSFVPFLLLKAGESKDTVRTDVRKIIDALCKLYPASKVFPLLMDGCKSKNARQRTECLDQIAMMIEVYDISVCGQPTSASLKAIAQCIGDRDNSVRNAALNALVSAYFQLGERVFSLVGNMSAKDFAMLEERIKRMTKNRPVITKPTPEKQERPKTAGGTVTKAGVRPQRVSSPPGSQSPLKCEEFGDGSPERQAQPRQTPSTVTRPRGRFQLEMDKLGLSEQEQEHHEMPELYDHTDAQEVLASPMQIPPLRFRPPSASSTPQRREVITQSMDASTALDTAINSVTSNKIDVATQALAQLDEIIKDASKVNLLADKVDQLLMAVYFQFRMAFNTHMMDESVSAEDVMRLYRYLCVVLLSMLAAGDLVRDASDGTLKDLVCQLLTVLLDERLEKIADGAQVIRSLNVMIVQLVAKSDPTSCLVALIRLLRDTLHSQTSSTKFLQLVLKCLWRLSRSLNQSVEIQIGRVLAEANAFFVDFPSAIWKQKGDEQPLRTMKTILYKLAELYGDKVLDHVDVIEKPESSEVVACLKRSLRELNKTMGAAGATNGAATSFNTAAGDTKPDDISSNYKGELNDIFKKIGSKEKSKEGLCELYEFKQRNPDVDIEPFLKKSSEFFRNYIRRGLEQVANERRARVTSSDVLTSGVVPDSAGGLSNVANNISGPVSSVYLEKLQKYRAAGGLEPLRANINLKQEEDPESLLPQVRMSCPNQSSEEGNGEAAIPQPRLTADEVTDFKARIERFKRGY